MRESNLIRRIKKGDNKALEFLIHEYYPSIYSFVSRKMQMDDSAKDITQEVFIRFIRQIPTYRHEGKLMHYLYRIASNVCKDHYKKIEYHEDIETMAYQLDTGVDVHEVILTQMRNEELMLLIDQLSDDQQNVIVLKYYQQLTFQEIADLYHLPVSTIKSRHTQALIKLRKFMKERDEYERT